MSVQLSTRRRERLDDIAIRVRDSAEHVDLLHDVRGTSREIEAHCKLAVEKECIGLGQRSSAGANRTQHIRERSLKRRELVDVGQRYTMIS